ncbi:DUF2225 domain-containing protein [Lachnospiraceae bacterium OM04-12BH]|nr:DUF2225 domain-containing protein [Lachnospiraceae bacterium OM04-12BH]
MAGLLSGLSEIGLGGLENMEVYEQPEDKEAEKQAEEKPEVKEETFLFDKSYECPVCYQGFKAKTVRSGKLRSLGTDRDLRPLYDQMEPLKYDVVICPHCGYAALTRFFGGLTAGQIKAIKENISANFHPVKEEKETYTYEEALYRYKLCLANTIVKHGKVSEKAYICLKAGWLLRSMGENLDPAVEDYNKKMQEIKEQEKDFLKNALDGLITARQTESYPICGMDEVTLEYLIAVLAMEFEKYDISSRLIYNILNTPTVNNRIKDKAREVKDELLQQMGKK